MSAQEAQKAIEAFFTGFNNRDSKAVAKSQHYPHFRVGDNGKPMVHEDEASFEIPFTYLQKKEGWHHSSLDSVEVVHAGEHKVNFAIEFSRYHENGEKYATHKSLWVVTKDDDGWGILIRSSFAP